MHRCFQILLWDGHKPPKQNIAFQSPWPIQHPATSTPAIARAPMTGTTVQNIRVLITYLPPDFHKQVNDCFVFLDLFGGVPSSLTDYFVVFKPFGKGVDFTADCYVPIFCVGRTVLAVLDVKRRGFPSIAEHPSIAVHPSIVEHPSLAVHLSISEHPSIAGHPSISEHPSIAVHLSISEHPSLAGHPSIAVHP